MSESPNLLSIQRVQLGPHHHASRTEHTRNREPFPSFVALEIGAYPGEKVVISFISALMVKERTPGIRRSMKRSNRPSGSLVFEPMNGSGQLDPEESYASAGVLCSENKDTPSLPSLDETLWSSCYGCPDGTSNDWTRGSLTFMRGHYAQDVIEGNRSLLKQVQLRVSSQQRSSLQTV